MCPRRRRGGFGTHLGKGRVSTTAYSYSAYFLAILFALTAVGKILSWPSFVSTLKTGYLLRLLHLSHLSWLVAAAVILLEILIAITLLISKTRKWGAFGSFVVLNVFLLNALIEKRLGDWNGFCLCFGFFRMSLLPHVTINVLGAGISMWLFGYNEMRKTSWRGFGLNLLVYCGVIGYLLLSFLRSDNRRPPFLDEMSAREWLTQYAGLTWPSTKLTALFFINLADLNCMYCANSIDQFIHEVSSDPKLSATVQLVVSHPDSLTGALRAKGWLRAQNLRLNACFVEYRLISSLGLSKSSILLFDKYGGLAGFFEFPYPTPELMKQIQRASSDHEIASKHKIGDSS